MLVTGWVSSRIGAKHTLIAGLVADRRVRARSPGSSDTIGGIVGFRAGWGLGNALFIATSLAVIVGVGHAAGSPGAIVLYETALGIGIACGPLLGGRARQHQLARAVLRRLGADGDRAGRHACCFVPRTPQPGAPAPRSSAPLKALRHRGLLTMGVTALLYNWGFFTMLGYAPFPMHLSIYELGFVFFGWGLLVALFSVFVAPRLQAPVRHRPHAVRQPRAVRGRCSP